MTYILLCGLFWVFLSSWFFIFWYFRPPPMVENPSWKFYLPFSKNSKMNKKDHLIFLVDFCSKSSKVFVCRYLTTLNWNQVLSLKKIEKNMISWKSDFSSIPSLENPYNKQPINTLTISVGSKQSLKRILDRLAPFWDDFLPKKSLFVSGVEMTPSLGQLALKNIPVNEGLRDRSLTT